MLYLDGDDPERSRRQSLIWDPEVETWLTALDVQPGWSCADLGCGALGILEPLSRHAGSSGRVIGIEPRPTLLAAAKEFVRKGRLDNVRLLDTAFFRTTLPDAAYHLVHARFLLAAGADDQGLLPEMIRLARPGGIVAIQEPDFASLRCYPDHEGWVRLREAVRSGFSAGGGDLVAGRRTFGLLRELGLEDVRVRAASIALQGAHPSKRLLVELAETHRERIVERGAVSEQELEGLLEECGRVARDPETVVVSFLVTQVWGRKAGRIRRLR